MRKLQLKRESIRQLTSTELKNITGAIMKLKEANDTHWDDESMFNCLCGPVTDPCQSYSCATSC